MRHFWKLLVVFGDLLLSLLLLLLSSSSSSSSLLFTTYENPLSFHQEHEPQIYHEIIYIPNTRTILDEIVHGGSQNRKRDWVMHWPFRRVTRSKVRLPPHSPPPPPPPPCNRPHSLLWTVCGPSQSRRILIYHSSILSRLAKEICERVKINKLFSLLCPMHGIRPVKPVYSSRPTGTHMIDRVFVVVIALPFCRLQRRPTSQPRVRSRLPWWPHYMNIVKDGPQWGDSQTKAIRLWAFVNTDAKTARK